MPNDERSDAPLASRIALLLGFVVVLWAIEAVDYYLLGQSLDGYGVRPRQAAGLVGILAAPLLHRGFAHLAANTLPLLALGGLVIMSGVADFLAVTILSAVVGGLGVWLFAPSNTVHLGASGLVFGYFGYLVLRGYYQRSVGALVVAAAVVVLYGGMLWGVLPTQPGVSWQGHLFGFLGGALAARLMHRKPAGASQDLIGTP
jgi:membrane associated rhomboid family serine protease